MKNKILICDDYQEIPEFFLLNEQASDVVITNDIAGELERFKCQCENIIVLTNLNYDKIKLALDAGVDIYLYDENKLLRTSNKIERYGYLLKSSKNEEQVVFSCERLCTSLINKLYQYGYHNLHQMAEEFIPRTENEMQFAKMIFRKSLKRMFKESKAIARSFVVIEPSDKVKIMSVGQYDDDFIEYVMSLKHRIVVLNDRPGAGKTERGTQKIIEFCKTNDSTVVTVTSKQLLAYAICKSEHDYKELSRMDNNAIEQIKWITAVPNTLYNGRFSSVIKKTKVLIIEEIEDLMSHFISKAAGNSIAQKAKLLRSFLEHCSHVDVIVIADAMCSPMSLRILMEKTGFDAIVYKQSQVNHTPKELRILPNDNLLHQEITDTLSISSNSSAIFCDASQVKTNDKLGIVYQLYSSKFKTMLISSAYFDDGKIDKIEWMRSIDDNISQCQCAIFSPVINVGVSIKRKFNIVSLISHGTLSPVQIIQMSQRVRSAEIIYMVMVGPRPSYITSRDGILWSMIHTDKMENDTDLDECYSSLNNNPYVQILIDICEQDKRLRKNYNNNLVWIAKLLGFRVKWVGPNNLIYPLQNFKRQIRDSSNNAFIETVLSANNIDAKRSQFLRGQTKRSYSEEAELMAYDIRSRTGGILTQELLEAYMGSKSKRIFENYVTINTGKCGELNREQAIYQILTQVLSKLGVNGRNFDSKISASQLKNAADYLGSGKIGVNGHSFDFHHVIQTECPYFKVSKQPLTMVNRFLTEMLDVKVVLTNDKTKIGQSDSNKRERLYRIEMGDTAKLFLKYLK